MKVGDKVKHKDNPARLGRVVAKSRRQNKYWSGQAIFLIRWNDTKTCSRHIGPALEKA